ncbi:hypothetical protein SAMN05216334_105136 [Nitrosomonas ureae]|uniref:Uncharacterized protein n=1 Tax=Nitrosomonas ureae TaxID=44577 RepID=A0A1H5TSJ5_9PROT|nr:hypothetical protein SAMN05216334_105136 [Nitrosomonas ureae]
MKKFIVEFIGAFSPAVAIGAPLMGLMNWELE